MKKNLLTLGVLALSLSANAQVFYSGDNSKVFVSSNALVYIGGNWKVDSDKSKTVENKGNVIIVGDYQKGAIANAAQDGKEFVNVYTSRNDYGQVKFLKTLGTSDARMTVERPALSSNYFGASAGIAFPYKDNVKYLMKSFGLEESAFRGDCAVGVDCGNRYKMNLTKWNNDKIHHDAVPSADAFKPGDNYNLNLREPNMQAVMKGTISYKGTPDGRAYSQESRNRAIHGLDETTFSALTYNEWKKRLNPYAETYESYMGYVDTTNKHFSKNIFRFGNPYTSNLDLSVVDGADAWVKILNNGERTIQQAYDAQLIRNFTVSKVMEDYDYSWGKVAGSVDGNGKFFMAKYDGTQWTGSAEALLIRPTEAFYLTFPTINVKNLGNTTIVKLKVDFTDNHKTFEYVPSAKKTTSSNLTASVFNFDNNPTGLGMMLAKDVAYNNIQSSDFYQLEVVLSKDNAVQASPVYVVGTNYYKESGAVASTSDKVFVYGVKDGGVAYESKKQFNEFNSETYVGKPLGLGFNNLENGKTYQLRLALYEDSIFNKVDELKNGAFYLKDNTTNKVTKVNTNDVITFVADANADKRFEFYWKEAPQGETSGTLSTNDIVKSQSTVVYRDAKQSRVRFENIANTAKVEVFSAAGTLVSSKDAVSTSTDYTLNLVSAGVYVVKVTYQNGEVRTLKVVNN